MSKQLLILNIGDKEMSTILRAKGSKVGENYHLQLIIKLWVKEPKVKVRELDFPSPGHIMSYLVNTYGRTSSNKQCVKQILEKLLDGDYEFELRKGDTFNF